jgi:hypothetical protein
MRITALIALLTVAFPITPGQTRPSVARADSDKHLHDIAQELPSGSLLRREILQGARGNEVRYPWMDEMAKRAVKRAVVWVDVIFDHKGRPTHTTVSRVEYFSQYDGDLPISDSAQLGVIRDSGLERQLKRIALNRAAHGSWVDVPRPTPKPFVGGVKIDLFDDEWLPVSPPIYFAHAPNNLAKR